jgi:DNA repair ATPase RecN
MTSSDKTVKSALESLNKVLDRLENAIDRRAENSRNAEEAAAELGRMLEDRSRLAQELDQSEHRSNRLEEANREVSRRLVTAMETIRAVLDR